MSTKHNERTLPNTTKQKKIFLQVYDSIFGGNRILFKNSTKGLSKSCSEILEFLLSFSPPSSSKCCWTSLKNLINWLFFVSPKLLSLNIAARESSTLFNFPSSLYTKLASTPLNSMYWLAPDFSTRSMDLSVQNKTLGPHKSTLNFLECSSPRTSRANGRWAVEKEVAMGRRWAQALADFTTDSAPWFHERTHCWVCVYILESLAPILESLFDEYGDVGAETNLSSRLKMNRRDCWVCVCILSDFWVCVCCFCVWLTRKICCSCFCVCVCVSGFVIFGF